MTKVKKILILCTIALAILLIPNIVNATVSVKKDSDTSAGTQKFYFSGLTLDKKHEYQFGLTKTSATPIEDKNWYLITEYTETTANIELTLNNVEFTDVITAVEKGYITIKDKTTNSVILDHFQVDLSIPFLKVTNYTVINNGQNFSNNGEINVNCWSAGNSKAFYQYEKITDEALINKYKEIKSKKGNYLELTLLLKTKAPTANWKGWKYWNGYPYNSKGIGHGYTEETVNVQDSGLYYMWLYFQGGKNTRDLYGCILVDNLQPDIAVESISLPGTEKVELEKTLKLTPTFNPEKATNKIVTWNSSDESVATVDNNGTVTPKKIGSTIITVVSKDGNKKATCTVTVVAASNNNKGNANSGTNNNTGNKTSTDGKEDKTTAKGTIPQTGVGIGLTIMIVVLAGATTIAYIKYKKLKNI